jgi:hypothetical protein
MYIREIKLQAMDWAVLLLGRGKFWGFVNTAVHFGFNTKWGLSWLDGEILT